jgi:glutamate-1-semialdehyde 2,1-aminomutase
MNEFLVWLKSSDATKAYLDSRKRVRDWMDEMNQALEKEQLPLRVSSYATVWTMLFTQPGRYHWFLQYLLRDEGVQLSWVGTGRLNFSLDFEKADLAKLKVKMITACKRMRDDGWWWTPDDKASFAKKIKARTVSEIVRGFFSAAVLNKKAVIN